MDVSLHKAFKQRFFNYSLFASSTSLKPFNAAVSIDSYEFLIDFSFISIQV